MTALKQMGENDLKELGIPMVINCLFIYIQMFFNEIYCCECTPDIWI